MAAKTGRVRTVEPYAPGQLWETARNS